MATRNNGGACFACDSLLRRLLTYSHNSKLLVFSTDVVIRPIRKACLLCPGSSSRHRQCQRTAQDADNRCHTFEKHTKSRQLRTNGTGTRNKICLHCLRPTKTFGTGGKTKTPRCAGPAHQQKDVFARPTKLCTAKRVPREAVSTRGHAGVCQFTVAVALQMQLKLFPTASTRCIFKWTVYHIGHVTTLYSTECSSVRTDN